MIATRSCGSSRKRGKHLVQAAARRKIDGVGLRPVDRDLENAHRLVLVLMPSVMSVLLAQTNQCIDCHGAAALRAHDDRVQIEFDESLEVGLPRSACRRVSAATSAGTSPAGRPRKPGSSRATRRPASAAVDGRRA